MARLRATAGSFIIAECGRILFSFGLIEEPGVYDALRL